MPNQEKINFQFSSQSVNGKGYEITFIHAGKANGWTFSPSVLRESAGLWENVEVFVDHSMFNRSVKELGGVLTDINWQEEHQALTARLTLAGPSREIIREAADVMLGEGAKPRLGFSADVLFTANAKKHVEKIIRPISVDLVIEPAFATKFIRQLNQKGALPIMSDETTTQAEQLAEHETATETNVSAETTAVREIMQAQEQVNAEIEQQRENNVAVCENLLESSLSLANLPASAEKDLRTRFAGRVFKAAELKDAIETWREALSEATAGEDINYAGRVTGGHSGGMSFEAAVYDLFQHERPDELKDVKAPRLSGIREMYTLGTGDVNFHGGYYPNAMRAKFETTTDLANLLADILNKIVIDQWNVMAAAGYEWWKPIVTVEQVDNMQDLKGIILSQVDLLPTVAEGASYTELAIDDNKETASFTKYGAYLGLTLEMFLKDDTRKMRAIPRIMANSGIRKISSLISAVFTANSGVGPTLADTKALFHIDHNNLGTTALSAAEWDVAQSATYAQTLLAPSGDDGGILGVDAKYLLVPRELKLTAMKIIYPTLENAANIYSENVQRGQPGDVIVVPEWTDANNWAAVCDPRIAPAITLGHIFGLQPEIFIAGNPTDYAVFDADESRIKVRHINAVLVSDYRPLYKENVA